MIVNTFPIDVCGVVFVMLSTKYYKYYFPEEMDIRDMTHQSKEITEKY